MTDLGRFGYALKREVNDISELERLFAKEMREDEEASFLNQWLRHQNEFEEFFSFFSAELASVGGKPHEGYEVIAGHKEYDFSGDLTWTSVMKNFVVKPLRSNYKFRITAKTDEDPRHMVLGLVGYDDRSWMNNHHVLYDASKSRDDLREEKPTSLTPTEPELFRQNLRATIDVFNDKDRKNLSRDIFFKEFFDKNKPFTREELQARIRERGGDPDYFNEHLRLDKVLPQWVENGKVKKVKGQYHIVYENLE